MPRRTAASDAHDNLGAYLNEHYLGSEGGLRAFRAAADTWEGTPQEHSFRALVDEIARDRRDLARIIRQVGHRPAPWKRLLTGLVAAIGRLGPYNLLRRRRGSMAQLELDVLTGAVRSKLSMWDALLAIEQTDARLDAALLRDLRARAVEQIDVLQELSVATAGERFAAGGRHASQRPAPKPDPDPAL